MDTMSEVDSERKSERTIEEERERDAAETKSRG